MTSEELVSESITPVPAAFFGSTVAKGQPGLPSRFTWRKQEYEVVELLGESKTTGPCSHGSAERYVRKHRYKVRTACGLVMVLSFDRQAGSGSKRNRWSIYTVER